MTIAAFQVEGVGARVYAPEGPLGQAGQFPFFNMKNGEVVAGDAEAEFVSLTFPVVATMTINQGDVVVWDNSYMATYARTGTGVHPFNASVGTVYLGGRISTGQNNQSVGNVWSITLTPGIYMIWAQRAGTSLANIATVNLQTKPLGTTAVNGQLNAPAVALAGSMGISGISACPTSWAFTGTTVIGSVNITLVSTNQGLVIGQQLSGTGIALGAIIKDIQGSLVVMSLAATAAGSVTITASNGAFVCTTTNASPNLTNVNTIAGVYPNATITGTGIAGVVFQILGNAAPYTIVMTAPSTATANSIAAVASGYIEAFMRWPQIQSQN